MADLSQSDRDLMAAMLEEYRDRWENKGDLPAVGEAVYLCGHNGFPLPSWCVEPILKGLVLSDDHSGRGRDQSLRGKLKKRNEHKLRHWLVKRVYNYPMAYSGKNKISLDTAFEIVASKLLKSHGVSAEAVKASYRTIEKSGK